MDNKFSNRLSSLFFYTGILVFIIASNTAHNPPSGWYQQFLPELDKRSLSDILFLDSLKFCKPYENYKLPGNDLIYTIQKI